MLSGLIRSEEKSVSTSPNGREWTMPQRANLGGNGMNLGIRILLLLSPKDLPRGGKSG